MNLARMIIMNVACIVAGLSLVMAQDSLRLPVDSISASQESLKNIIPDSAYIAMAADSSWWTRKVVNPAFGVGEYLEFGLAYGIISAGTATMEIPDTILYKGRWCYHIKTLATSGDFISTFFKVRDTVESYIDKNGIFTYYFRKHLREGGYKIDRITEFDQQMHLAITGKDTIPTYAFVQDVLSSLYYLRTQQLVPGVDVLIDNHIDKKNYPLRVIVHGKEKTEVPAGKFNCVIVEPVMRYEGIFKAKGKIKIWLTDDQYKMPVKMQTEVFLLGSISAKLKKYTYGKSAI